MINIANNPYIPGDTIINIPAENLEEFKHAMVRAMATWQDASSEMKYFYDQLNGNTHWPMAKR